MQNRFKRGFTLTELLVVVAIIAILCGIGLPLYAGAIDKANAAVDAANLHTAKTEAAVFKSSGDSLGGLDSTNVYYDYGTNTWKAAADDTYQGKASANADKCIKATFDDSGVLQSVDWCA